MKKAWLFFLRVALVIGLFGALVGAVLAFSGIAEAIFTETTPETF